MNTTLKQFLKNPLQTGAVCASSRALALELMRCSKADCARNVVELGPGTGAVTETLLKNLAPDSRFIALELDKSVIPQLRKRFPGIEVINESASDLPRILKQVNMPLPEAIVSCLPWAVFPSALQEEILNAVAKSMPENGIFTTFAYITGVCLPAGLRFRKLLKEKFPVVTCSEIVWNNVPPAFCYVCQTRL